MKRKLIVLFQIIVLCSLVKNFLFGEERFSWDFSECEIKDIIYAISLDTGISIIADDTVNGKTDFRFSGVDFDNAFDSFLRAARLYVLKDENLWTVSRVQFNKTDDCFCLDAFDVRPKFILEKVSEFVSDNISYEQLPSQDVSVHLESKSLSALLTDFVKFLPGFKVFKTERGFHFAPDTTRKEKESSSDFSIGTTAEEKIKIEIKNASFSKVCEELFRKSEKNFCFAGNQDIKACRTIFEAESFDKALDLICEQNNFTCQTIDGVYYIFPKEEKKNSFLYGNRKWVYFPLKYSSSEKILPVFSMRFRNIETAGYTGESGFWANATEEEQKEIISFIQQVDVKKNTYLIQLKNIKADEFLKRLPPSIEKNSISEADGNCCLYFTGTEESYKKLIAELELCDRPQKRIKYDLLIIQYDDTDDNQWGSGLKLKSIQKGDKTGFSAQLGSVLGLNFNVLTAFGVDFAASLQASISQNKSRVFADTTLHGIAGKEINFTNTNTYRYRDNNLDPETGKPVYSGITREIISGLKLDIKPWVGEDGVITTQVKASVTRRGTDTSSITGNPPPTSEKIVTTEVCGKSGEPVVLSGLIQNNETDEIVRTPVFSKIPLIRKLFKNEKHSSEKMQMVIYLVPFLEKGEQEKQNEKYGSDWLKNRKEGLCRILTSN